MIDYTIGFSVLIIHYAKFLRAIVAFAILRDRVSLWIIGSNYRLIDKLLWYESYLLLD